VFYGPPCMFATLSTVLACGADTKEFHEFHDTVLFVIVKVEKMAS